MLEGRDAQPEMQDHKNKEEECLRGGTAHWLRGLGGTTRCPDTATGALRLVSVDALSFSSLLSYEENDHLV